MRAIVEILGFMSLDMNLLLYFQIEIYEDNDNARKDEIAALGGQTATGTNVFSAFYDRLKEVFLTFFCLFFFAIQMFLSLRFLNARNLIIRA